MCGGPRPASGVHWTCIACTTRSTEAAKNCSLCHTARQEGLHEFASPVEQQLLGDPVNPAALAIAEIATGAVDALLTQAAQHTGVDLPMLQEAGHTCMLPADRLDPADKRLWVVRLPARCRPPDRSPACLSTARPPLRVSLATLLPVCLSVWLPACLSVCLSVCMRVCLPVCLSVCLFVYLSFLPHQLRLPTCACAHPHARLPI